MFLWYHAGMSDELVLTQIEAGVATVTMNRPDKRNALNVDLIEALGEAVTAIEQRDEVRVLILAGAGKSFCAGMDLRGVIDDAKQMGHMLRRLSEVSRQIRRLPIPTIARVQGAAVGGGCGLMVVPDFAITHPEARVGYPEVSLGVCPAVVAPWLIKKVGAGAARAMLLGGGTMSGQEGYDAGLATHLVQQNELEDQANDLAHKLAKGGPHAMAVTKRWLNELDTSMDDAVFDKAWQLSAEVIAGEEAQARLRPMFEK